MANKSNTSSSVTSTPATAVGVGPTVAVSVPAGAASGTTSGTSVPGTVPASATRPPSGLRNTVQQLVNGINKDIPVGSSITVAGVQMNQAQLLAVLTPVLAAFTAITDAESTVKQARLSLTALLPQARLFAGNLKAALIAQFGLGSPLLADFGVKDGAARKKATTKEKMAAVVKADGTRELRGTTGKVAKLAVKFQGQVVPASAAPASSAPDGSTSNTGSGNAGSSSTGA